MRFTLPFVSLVLFLSSEGFAAAVPNRITNETPLSAMTAQRQTIRDEIQLREHVENTVKRVNERSLEEGHEALVDSVISTETGDERRRSHQVGRAEVELEARSSYPKCKKTTPRTGYAHYPGWRLVGDELSGAIPVKPESACIQACNKYGGACSGVFFDSANGKCFLKGVKTSAWNFAEGLDEDGTDLIGGCSLWSNIVPEEMDAVCCRD